ncbi:class I SAM-dependent methyltransferase [Nocardia jejuensis]|uniref:class I SAM-dependent methyltransferase n=1 Tax=Nocardia jejuensis TaxID=328049 RepID=UPI00082B21E7|nr:class I SAM-dependent methyltransferase [Nocardia jejuensis]
MSWVTRNLWDHNAFYHRLLLRRIPASATRVLDVGCGAGVFASKVAARGGRVDAIDRSEVMIAQARRTVPVNVTCILGDILTEPLPAGSYDAIVSVTALHHLPLPQVLPILDRALRPGGVLVAIALPKFDPVRDIPVELAAFLAQRVGTLTFAALRTIGRGSWYARESTHDEMPVLLDPPLTTHQVREQATALLSGARVRRLLFWRYLLVWNKPD